ncbi:2-oxoglutarate ferredoxin oxidoreductase subunit beta [Natranaerovirga hydrolytica]|uniref:2-oxoglutarate ferredoxin oxidoreductase subunit beta n=1 Tax=Natranaerovirga hydrolytica TaxID=680378 RepID=A0A4R1MX03_9FIRM|nr:2-oxoacid:ferredoxin oxidoreductase subunit beta [Natranaerovirga hydrolytica]TCK97778.1 2-oxoglutarate ferredoxin oxidoreductase subunit beta [Natranaerovirga hydrolytica]
MTDVKKFDRDVEIAWCPGCGDFSILNALKTALSELDLEPHQVTVVSGIGQAAKMPQYIRTNGFNGLHGRALPPALAIKTVNKDMNVIVNSGDGDSYGEGGNHLLHNIRRNVNIAHFVHDNQIYGLTKGQASPTTDENHKTAIQPEGVIVQKFNPIAFAIANGAGFVARSFSGDIKHLTETMKAAIQYNGYAIVDILQPCVSFNKINTFKWYKDRVYALDHTYDPSNKSEALIKADEWGDDIPIGIIYKRQEQPSFTDLIPQLNDAPLIDRKRHPIDAEKFMNDFK